MFGLFKTQKSPVRRRLETSISVHRTWYEWSLENGQLEPTLIVEFAYETDPDSPKLDRDGLDEVMKMIADSEPGETPPARVKIIPRMYGL